MNLTATAIYQASNAPNLQGWYEGQGAYNTNSTAQLPYNTKFELYNLTYNWAAPIANITATGSYYRTDVLRTTDFTPSYVALENSSSLCKSIESLSAACTPTQMNAYNAYVKSQLRHHWRWRKPAYVVSQNYEVRATRQTSPDRSSGPWAAITSTATTTSTVIPPSRARRPAR